MLTISRKPRLTAQGETWSSALDAGLRAAARRITLQSALRAAALTLPLVLLAAFLYIYAARHTLAVLPRWPIFFLVPAWLVGLWLWSRTRRVTTAEAARYLDRVLQLDERVSTSVEVVNRHRLTGGRHRPGMIQQALVVDTGEAIDSRKRELPPAFRIAYGRADAIVTLAAMLALLAALFMPTNADQLRAQKLAIQKQVQQQLADLRALKVQVADNKQLSDDLKQSVLAQLDAVESRLNGATEDRDAAMAALSDTEDKLRNLLQKPSSEFDALIASARAVWSAAASFNWAPSSTTPAGDLGKASEASLYIAGQLPNLHVADERSLSLALESAGASANTRDTQLGKLLADSAGFVRSRDRDKASNALAQVSQRFGDLEKQYADATALESVLSKLNQGREDLTQVGQPLTKKQQVGFRRRDNSASAGSEDDGSARPMGPQTNNGDDGTLQMNSGGVRPGGVSNNGGYNAAQVAPLPQSGAPSQAGASGAPSGGKIAPVGSSSGGGQGDGTAQSGPGGSAGGGADSGQKGTLGGQVSGPVGGTSGAISQVVNPAGNGVATGQSGQTAVSQQPTPEALSSSEQVYVQPQSPGASRPPTDSSSDGKTADEEGQGGRAGAGGTQGDGKAGEQGAGSLVQVKTPYKAVIGQYAQQATEALDRAYIPPDAKEYVKQYFSGLGK